MKLTEKMRSKLAERICREWIRKRKLKLSAPKVYVCWRVSRGETRVWGAAYSGQRLLSLHLGIKSKYNDWIVLLAHEFAHYLDYWTSGWRWRRANMPHGERFQRLFWNTLSRVHWPRAGSDFWVTGPSKHLVQYQTG